MQDFNQFILDNQIIGFFDEPVQLKSGRKSNYYVNWRKATNDAFLLHQLTDHIVSFLQSQELSFDSLIGVPEGASKTAVVTALKWAQKNPQFGPGSHIIPMGRAKPKSHGAPEDRYFIGAPQGRVLVLEDTITTGISLYSFIDKLLENGFNVVGAICLTDRMEKRDDQLSVATFISQRYQGHIKYLRMSTATELLPAAFQQNPVSEDTRQALLEEFQNYGVTTLNLGDNS